MTETQTTDCPCGSGQTLDACCGPILAGTPAPTAEALMRSRYTAFAVGNVDHVANTNAAELHASFDRANAEEMSRDVKWIRLEVVDVSGGRAEDETGRVEFRAFFKRLGQDLVHHEAASFRREDGRWVYAESQMNPKGSPRRVVHVGRNDPCPCGSGKKYKKCCGN